MITNERRDKSLVYLAETDLLAAELKVEVQRMDYKCDQIAAAVFLREDGNIQERQAKAKITPEYQKAKDDYHEALVAYEAVKNKRKTEELIVEVWRSLEASRRQAGQL